MTETITGTFVSKEFKKKGTKNGKDWAMYKIGIKKNMTDEYPVRFDAFNSCKGLDKVKEGDVVKAGFKEGTKYTNSFGKEVTPKQIIWIALASEESKQESVQVEEVKDNTIKIAQFENFAKDYTEAMKDNPKKSVPHMVGSYVLTHFAENNSVFAELRDKCNKFLMDEEAKQQQK